MDRQLPSVYNFANLSIGLFVLVAALYLGQAIILPLLFAAFIATALNPLVDRLVKWHFNRIVAILLVMVILSLTMLSIIVLVVTQLNKLSQESPELMERSTIVFNEFIVRISELFDLDRDTLKNWFETMKTEALNTSASLLTRTLSTAGGILAAVLLTPVYVFMLLNYHNHILTFLRKLFGRDNHLKEILLGTKNIIQKYILGLSAEIGILAVMNTGGLLLLGIEYSLLLGIAGAFLNLIPYLGGWIAVTIYMLIALVTKPPEYALYVLLLYSAIQFIDNNFIVPKVVGSIVRLNALASFLAVICGAALWGIPGMFISIPLIAILKVTLDHVEPLAHWGFLLGNGNHSDETKSEEQIQ